MSDAVSTDNLYLGLDSSTQGLKAIVIDDALDVVYEKAINFDTDLPEFGTEGGAHHASDGKTVTAPAIMWVAAVDLLFSQMKADGCPFSRIVAVSGSGQQHGSVWLNETAPAALEGLKAGATLREQLGGIFSRAESPIWMDASTTAECRALEEAMGGAQAVADVTGSRAYERFTGNQIAKIYKNEPDIYAATSRIALVSSFVASLLAGKVVPIDASDGSGMNVMNIRTLGYDPTAVAATAPGLDERLGAIVPSHTGVGTIHGYFAETYGFRPDCAVIAFSGDNPNSLAGLRLQEAGDLAISLGTSDTLFGTVAEPAPSGEEGHVFVNPVLPDAFMVMLVRQNGSLTRERIRNEVAGGNWDTFSRMLEETAPGNGGAMGLYVDTPEITPPIHATGAYRWNAEGQAVESFTPEQEIRAVVEGQFLSLCLHAGRAGVQPRRLLATGGASANRALLRVVADIFCAPVYVAESTDSAALGSAYRALHGWRCAEAGYFVPYAAIMQKAPPLSLAARPDPAAHEQYRDMLGRIGELETSVAGRPAG